MEISAVLPAFNEEANLEQSVGRMAQALNTYARNSEIIVVDDGRLDQTPFVLGWMAGYIPRFGWFAIPTIVATEPRSTLGSPQHAALGCS